MKTVLINGGLGNQTFQYIFGRAVELTTGEKVLYDDSYFCTSLNLKHSNGASAQRLQLKEVFDIDINTLSNTILPEEWSKILSLIVSPVEGQPYSIPEFLRSKYADLIMIAETGDYKFNGSVLTTPACIHNPQVYNAPPNTYYHGYWINKWWLYSYKDILFQELRFKPIVEPHNLAYARQIQETNSVAIHIRRFSVEGYQWDLSPEFYRRSMLQFTDRLKDATYFIFSDVLSYCKSNYQSLGLDLAGNNIVFVEGNESETLNFRDMQLMSMCKHMIIANSSFSYLAALLNTNPNKLISNPTNREI